MELHAHIELVVGQLHGFHDIAIGRSAADHHAGQSEHFAEIVVEFVAVAMALADQLAAIGLVHPGARLDGAGVCPQAQRAALGHGIVLIGQEIDHLVGAFGVKFARVGIGQPGFGTGKGDHGDLHTKADAKIRHMALAAVIGGGDHALDAALAKAAGHQNARAVAQHLGHIFLGDGFRVDPANVHIGAQLIPGVPKRFRHRKIGIVQLHILAHQADGNGFGTAADLFQHGVPAAQIDIRCIQVQLAAHDGREIVFLQHDRRFVQGGQRDVFDHAVRLDIAEHGDLFKNRGFQRFIAPQHNDIRLYAHALQLFHRMLGGLGFVFVRSAQKRHQRYMNEQAVFGAYLQRDLAHSLHKGLRFDIADGAADLGDHHIGIGLPAHPVYKLLDLVGDMRDHLHGRAQIFALALFVEHIPIHLARGKVGVAVQIFVNESLVVPQIQIGLCAVLGHIHLAVLIRAHGARVHIDIWIQLLRRHLQAAGLQKPPQRCGGNALAKARNHAARNKNILCVLHSKVPPSICV